MKKTILKATREKRKCLQTNNFYTAADLSIERMETKQN